MFAKADLAERKAERCLTEESKKNMDSLDEKSHERETSKFSGAG